MVTASVVNMMHMNFSSVVFDKWAVMHCMYSVNLVFSMNICYVCGIFICNSISLTLLCCRVLTKNAVVRLHPSLGAVQQLISGQHMHTGFPLRHLTDDIVLPCLMFHLLLLCII